MDDPKWGDGCREIWFLNRELLILRPRQPFIDWVRKCEPEGYLSDNEVRDAPSAFLIPEFELTWESLTWVRVNCRMLFELHLDEWYSDSSMWPARRDWKTFKEWCEVEYVDLAWDLVDAPLSSDPPIAERG
ncbi:MAG: hypothetical protein RQ745_09860 [Longimicrobiales bacterium]|nr:hypothetical protein [Longimicrobiales bacterium]